MVREVFARKAWDEAHTTTRSCDRVTAKPSLTGPPIMPSSSPPSSSSSLPPSLPPSLSPMTVLGDFLDQICLSHQVSADEIAIIKQLAEAAKSITEVIKHNGIQSDLGEDVGAENADGDVQKALDVLAEEIIIERLRKTSVAYVLSEEREEALPFRDADELFKGAY